MEALEYPLCEIRVPTYRRPVLLRRALGSVIAQTYSHWVCCVFDDCPDQSGRAVVDEFKDHRIHYFSNPSKLLAIGNIDQSFRSAPFWGGSYACVLEDDNYLLPHCLDSYLDIIKRAKVELVIAAQLCESVHEKDVPGRLLNERTLIGIYEQGLYTPDLLHAALMFSHAFSNGSVFWKLSSTNDLEIGPVTNRPGIQETLRVLKINSPAYISHTPASVWRWNSDIDSSVSLQAITLRQRLLKRIDGVIEAREALDYRLFYLRAYGRELIESLALSRYELHLEVIENALLKCGYFSTLSGKSTFWRLKQYCKWLAFRTFIPSRLRLSGGLFPALFALAKSSSPSLNLSRFTDKAIMLVAVVCL